MTLDVYADIACPWCYIGERRLFAALAERPDLDAQPRWRPFQLQPQLPPTGLPWRAFAERKFGGWENARRGFRHVEAAAADDGIAFDLEGIATAANTAEAHRLILLGRERGREWETAAALFRAYFAEGRDLNDPDHLLGAAESAGLDREEAATWLASDAGREEVAAGQREAARLGVTGVPFYVLDGRLGVSGAQPAEVLVQALDRVAEAA